jgi:hypothetical protein
VRLRRWRLDQELAAGCAPQSSEDRAVRAQQLANARLRRQLARSLRRVVADAENPARAYMGASVPGRREVVLPWREGLLGLADRLEQPGSVNPRGVARVLGLLTDATGPLYNLASERTMSETLWWVADGLQNCPPHDWACPVVMKIDPEHVAWTCAQCGATTLTDDPGVRPA